MRFAVACKIPTGYSSNAFAPTHLTDLFDRTMPGPREAFAIGAAGKGRRQATGRRHRRTRMILGAQSCEDRPITFVQPAHDG